MRHYMRFDCVAPRHYYPLYSRGDWYRHNIPWGEGCAKITRIVMIVGLPQEKGWETEKVWVW